VNRSYQFDRWLEKIHEHRKLILIQPIDCLQGRGEIVTVPSHEFLHMGPVFLLNMSVIVFSVRTAAGKLNSSLLAIPPKMVIDKLRTIIRVYAQYIKGKHFGDCLQSLDTAGQIDLNDPPAAFFGPEADVTAGQKKSIMGSWLKCLDHDQKEPLGSFWGA